MSYIKSLDVNSLKSARCCCRLEQTPLKPFLASALYVTSEQEITRNDKKKQTNKKNHSKCYKMLCNFARLILFVSPEIRGDEAGCGGSLLYMTENMPQNNRPHPAPSHIKSRIE